MIYRKSHNKPYYWITQYWSPGHIYLECYWCKKRGHLFHDVNKDVEVKDVVTTRKKFLGEHRSCKDQSVQMEMVFA